MGHDKKKLRTTCHLIFIKKNRSTTSLEKLKPKNRIDLPLKILKIKLNHFNKLNFYYNHIIMCIIIALSSKNKEIRCANIYSKKF